MTHKEFISIYPDHEDLINELLAHGREHTLRYFARYIAQIGSRLYDLVEQEVDYLLETTA
jgi:hypothetical protein